MAQDCKKEDELRQLSCEFLCVIVVVIKKRLKQDVKIRF